MVELDPGVMILRDEFEVEDNTCCKKYEFSIDGEAFSIKGPTTDVQMRLFDDVEDMTVEAIDSLIEDREAIRDSYQRGKWLKLKIDLGLVAVFNAATLSPKLLDDKNELIEILPEAGLTNMGVLAFLGLVDTAYAKIQQNSADREDKQATRLRRIRPYFENIQSSQFEVK